MTFRKTLTWTLLLGIASFAAGCGKSGPTVTTVPVSGTVFLDQKPLPDVTVVFIGEGLKFVGMGKTGPDGKYQLDQSVVPGKRGAMPGKNQVHFTKADDKAAEGPPMIPPTSSSIVQPQKGPLPAKYCDPQKPLLTFEVPEKGTQAADFQLSSK
ncbi:MAG: hypothetical protein ABFD16_30195 [Thermoguttaceae bacterium]|jgi:hypothetical protein